MATEKRKSNQTANRQGLTKEEDGAMIKKMTAKEAEDFMNEMVQVGIEPDRIMQELREDLLPKIQAGKDSKEDRERTTENISKALIISGLDNHYPLAETVEQRYRPLVIEFARGLVQEYNCQTPSEKALAQVVVGAYARILEYSRSLQACGKTDWFSHERNGFCSMLSKELDRANRHFVTALTTLKQIRTPSLQINVRTRAAFVAQNQQLNVNNPGKDSSQENENVETK